jgi:hypothetical protein
MAFCTREDPHVASGTRASAVCSGGCACVESLHADIQGCAHKKNRTRPCAEFRAHMKRTRRACVGLRAHIRKHAELGIHAHLELLDLGPAAFFVEESNARLDVFVQPGN